MKVLDFVLRNLALVLELAAFISFTAYVIRGVLAIPKYSLSDRVREFVRSHQVQVASLLAIASTPFLLFSFSDIKTPLVTAGLSFPNALCSKPGNRKLLLFIHGWDGDSQSTWQKFPHLTCQDPRFTDVDVVAINYPTFMARRNLNLAQLSSWINDHLDFGETGRYQRVVIIAHSMGGLVTREIIILKDLKQSQNPIAAVVEVGSPHLGANPARLASALGISSPLADELREGSSFLITLQTEWQQIKNRPRTQCFTSPHDEVVPENSAIFQCDGFTYYPQWGHRELVKPEDLTDDRYLLPTKFLIPFFQSRVSLTSKHPQ
jgi:triacylglycerol esterase/lipase EstA (alpha/beta hydrolase family)